jgi:CRP/FNR family cyclic AMP-dependent transcriptional regulator
MKDDSLGQLFSDGEVIIAEGSIGEEMFSILGGSARVVKQTPAGKMNLAVLKEGDIFGEMSLFDHKPRSASVISQGQARILRIDRSKLLSSIGRDPTIVLKMLESMSKRIRDLDAGFANLHREEVGGLVDRLDIDTLCDVILTRTLNLIGANCGFIALADRDGDVLKVTASAGKNADSLQGFAKSSNFMTESIKSGKPMLIKDVDADRRFSAQRPGTKSLICVPLLFVYHHLGALIIAREDRQFTDNDLGVAESIAELASVSIQNTITLERYKSTAGKIIYDATSSITTRK